MNYQIKKKQLLSGDAILSKKGDLINAVPIT